MRAITRLSGLLRMLLLFHARTASAVGALGLFQTHVLILHVLLRSVKVFLKHRLGLDSLELGLEVGDVMAMGAAVGTTTGIGELVAIVLTLLAWGAPFAQCREQGCIAASARQETYQLPFPPPSFFTFLGSAST